MLATVTSSVSAASITPVQAAILGIVQGLTEFLPVSSSAHLFAVPALFGWPYAGLAFDVALHWGTLLALLVAFRDEWRRLFAGAFSKQPDERGAAWTTLAQLALGCVPAAIAGLLLEDLATTHLRALPVQAVMLVVFGFLLWWVDRVAGPGRPTAPGWAQSFLIGLAQSLALVPGVSRSGVTLTAGRALGLSRLSAARFSFLLATPITFGAGVLELRHLDHSIPLGTLGIGVGAAALTGFLAIRGLLAWLSRAGLFAFFAYRVAFAVLLIVFALRGR